MRLKGGANILYISIHALCEEGDPWPLPFQPCRGYFYPRPLRGGRQGALSQVIAAAQFLSTPSARRATSSPFDACVPWSDFYPRPLRGGRPALLRSCRSSHGFLSTPSARRATTAARLWTRRLPNFYPRPLRGGRPEDKYKELSAKLFLSTPSARRATQKPPRVPQEHQHFYPRPLRGGRRPSPFSYRAGGYHFYPRPLRGGRPCPLHFQPPLRSISIHALCEEGDSRVTSNQSHRC